MTVSSVRQKQLNWSSKQVSLLTCSFQAESYYTEDNGYPFRPEELPHHLLNRRLTVSQFQAWRQDQASSPIVGAWKRPLFYSAFDHSSQEEESVFNVQTNTLFVDLRIPTSRNPLIQSLRARNVKSWEGLDREELRLMARQHVFAGFSRVQETKNASDRSIVLPTQNKDPPYPHFCTRHHCMDWNYIGGPGRSRPNKWWIELSPSSPNVWKEWAYATDPAGQHYYCERWERLPGSDSSAPIVALRRVFREEDGENRDGIIVVVGNHFNYCIQVLPHTATSVTGSSFIERVDNALDKEDDVYAARNLLCRLQAGHGHINSREWMIDEAIEFWKEGTPLWNPEKDLQITGYSINDCQLTWNGDIWEVFETNLPTIRDFELLVGMMSRARL